MKGLSLPFFSATMDTDEEHHGNCQSNDDNMNGEADEMSTHGEPEQQNDGNHYQNNHHFHHHHTLLSSSPLPHTWALLQTSCKASMEPLFSESLTQDVCSRSILLQLFLFWTTL